MKQRIVTICLMSAALAAGIAGWSPPTTAAVNRSADQTLLLSAKQKHSVRYPRQPAGKIACTPAGCHRIPPGCYPEPDFDFWGNPTGYDRIVCPRR
jgi:hypothetical protein